MMARTYIYRSYRFIDKDPVIDAVRTVVQQERLKNSAVHAVSGVATATLDNWFDGPTRQPQNSTVTAVTAALGYARHDEITADGRVVVGFRKRRKLDWKEEALKQADWVIKHAQPKKKRAKKKSNGHG
jgi:hypothetical protein